uniref:Uncharacterized protein n=1 Tax=Solanum tuberosum TaxID=4113 RepID=M1DTB3_SOLTU
MVQWTKHSGKRYHQSLPYAHMLRETRVWLKVVMNYQISRFHYTNITRDKLGEVARLYPLNDHGKTLLGIGPEFRESVDNDIPTDEENVLTSSDVESDSEEEVDPDQAGDEAVGGDMMED